MKMLRLLVFTFGAWLLTAHAQAQTALKNLQVTDRRPVEAAVLELIGHYPVVITYEDPQFRYAGDVEDLTDQARKKHPNARGLIGPRVGTLHANYEVSQETGELANVSAALVNIVNAKNADAVGGRFKVLQIGDVYHVIPTEIRDSTGAWIKQTSILDVRITLKTGELNGAELLKAILEKVSEASGQKLGWGIDGFNNTFAAYRGGIDVKDEPARDVLIDMLHDISDRFGWAVHYVPADKDYFFGVTLAAEPPPKEIPLDLSSLRLRGAPNPAGGVRDKP
jgi:hypothetical protein